MLTAGLTQWHVGAAFVAGLLLWHRIRRGGMIGLKVYHQYRMDDSVFHPVFERCAELGVPMLMHAGHATVVAAVGMSTANVPCTATVARWFARRRGLATGVASAGGSFGAFCLPPIAQLLVSGVGWRRAYVIFGAAILLALNLLAPLMKRDPEGLGLTPDGDRPAARGDAPSARGSNHTMRQAMRTGAFWVLFALFAATQRVFSLDYTAQALVQGGRHPLLEAPMRALTLLGSGYVLAVLCVPAWFLLRRRGHPLQRALPAVVGGAFFLK